MLTSMPNKTGFFITLEGGEGAGKSTMLKEIEAFLSEQNLPYESTREPGGTMICEQMRSILLTKYEQENLCSISELLLMYASRAQLVNHKIKPLLEQGVTVISDRFDLSTLAYQGAGRGFDIEIINKAREIAIGNFTPDLTILFDIDVQKGMERVVARGKKDRFEQEEIAFFERIRQCYLEYAYKHTDKVVIIDGGQELEIVKEQVRKVLAERLFIGQK